MLIQNEQLKNKTDNKNVPLKKAKNLIASLDAELAQEGKIQPVVYMFRAKNFYGMQDKQEVVVTPNNPLGDSPDQATIAQKCAELPGID